MKSAGLTAQQTAEPGFAGRDIQFNGSDALSTVDLWKDAAGLRVALSLQRSY